MRGVVGAELLKLREEMYAAESDRFDKAALQAVDELKKAADKCAAAVETITVSLSKLEGAPEMRKRASAGAKIHAARVAARASAIGLPFLFEYTQELLDVVHPSVAPHMCHLHLASPDVRRWFPKQPYASQAVITRNKYFFIVFVPHPWT